MSKIWIISDTHFGVRNNSKKWEELMRSWMEDTFLPLVDSEKEEGDVLIHLGDVFDNRQSVCLSSMNLAIDFFERLSTRFDKIWILCGNHDAYYTNRNDITSIECFKHIPHVSIVKTPLLETIFGKKILLLPWIENKREFNKSVYSFSPEILFCHAEFYGCTMNASKVYSDSDLDIPDILKIYSGHIHHRQKYKNVTYIGSPYQLTQNDRNNNKGVWTYDPQKDEERFYFNCKSPEFMRMKYQSISEMTLQEFKQTCSNKFVEIETEHSLMAKCQFQKLLSFVQDSNIMDLSFVPAKSSQKDENDINISNCVSITEMLKKYIDEFVYCDEDTKKSVRQISKKLINE